MSAEAKVQRGIKLLDRERPGWRSLINVPTLNAEDCFQCVLGQIYGHYYDGVRRLQLRPWQRSRYGFTAGLWPDYRSLTYAWRQALS